MSFKREGNDKGLLDNLRKRRVKELLGVDIPEDEAKLLSNGRFACLVCSHNPIFDTVNMLMVHRQGKKHAAGSTEFLRKKKELQTLIQKRKHEQYMKDGTTNINQAAPTSCGGIMTSQAYDPRVKKHKSKPYDRKHRVNLLDANGTSSATNSSAAASSHTAFNMAIPTKHGSQLKNIFCPRQTPKQPLQPYLSHRRVNSARQVDSTFGQHLSKTGHLCCVSATSEHLSDWSMISEHSSHHQSFEQLTEPLHSHSHQLTGPFHSDEQPSISVYCDNNQPLSTQATIQASQCVLWNGNEPRMISGDMGANSSWTSNSRAALISPGASNQEVKSSASSDSLAAVSSLVNKQEQSSGEDGRKKNDVQASTVMAERKKALQKFHHLSGSGWKRDWDGKWIRDEEAEFDSDEEPPEFP